MEGNAGKALSCFPAESTNCGAKSKIMDNCGMKILRDMMNFIDNVLNSFYDGTWLRGGNASLVL